MSKSRIYILQCLAMVLLLCCYLLRDRPDRLSRMHFDSTSPTVIKKSQRTTHSADHNQPHVVSSTHNTDRQKTELPKHISFEPMVPVTITIPAATIATATTHNEPLQPEYKYLFYEEINPPPPKC